MDTSEAVYEIDPGSFDDIRDLTLGLCAHLFRELRAELTTLRSDIAQRGPAWQQGLPPRLLGSFREQVVVLIAECGELVKELDEGFRMAYHFHELERQCSEQRAVFHENLHRNMTYLCTRERPRTWFHMGWIEDQFIWPLALSRDEGLVILCSGIQGSGKTQFSSILAEAGQGPGMPVSSRELFPISHSFFHIESQDRLPQLLDGLKENPNPGDLDLLGRRLGVTARGLRRLRLVIPETLMEALMPRLLPYIDLGLEVLPLKIHLSQLGQQGLEAALGAETGARYVQRMLEEAQRLGRDLTLAELRRFIDEAQDLNVTMKLAAHARLNILAEVASAPDEPGLWEMFGPGVITVVYLGGPFAGRGKVLALLSGLLHGLMLKSEEHGEFQRTIVVDEINELDRDEVAWRAFTRVARLVRHQGSTLMLMGQDLLAVPDELFGLAGLVVVFQLRNPRIWEHIRERVGSLREWGFADVEKLGVGEALVGVTVTTDPRWQHGARKVKWRPLLCEHGGKTRAVM